MTRPVRITVVLVAFVAAVAAVIGVFLYLIKYPATVTSPSSAPGEANVTLETVGALNYGEHATWVSYLAQENGQWLHTTVLKVPANSLVHFTITQYDTGSPIRNPFMDQVQGTVDGVEVLNGKPVKIVNDFSDNGIGHTFAIPSLGISVPLPGVSGDSTNFCDSPAPCPTTYDHNTIEFTIHTGAPGTYPWQCFVPCAAGWPIGFGGPMSTFGYMGGYLKVVA
jgi:hypothetical protein